MAEVIFNKLEKVYSNGFKAVHGIDLKIADGEFMVIVGPSGCAKSTTLRMLAGLETISGGEVRIGDKIVNNLAPKSRGIAMVFQNYALYPHMTVRENLAFGLKLSKLPKAQIDRQVEEAAKILDLEELLERLPGVSIQANILTRKLNVSADRLYNDYGIRYESRRTHEGRVVKLTLENSGA